MKTKQVAGLVIALMGVGGAASILLTSQKTMQPVKPGTPAEGVPLTNKGETNVGYASSIPSVRPVNTGPVNMDYNPGGWDYAQIGVRR